MTGINHLRSTFEEAERLHPDLMEPHSTRLAEAQDASEAIAIMREGLRRTFRQRYPMPDDFWPEPQKAREVVAP